eukprot:5115076-Amphidinium_carterae.1
MNHSVPSLHRPCGNLCGCGNLPSSAILNSGRLEKEYCGFAGIGAFKILQLGHGNSGNKNETQKIKITTVVLAAVNSSPFALGLASTDIAHELANDAEVCGDYVTMPVNMHSLQVS